MNDSKRDGYPPGYFRLLAPAMLLWVICAVGITNESVAKWILFSFCLAPVTYVLAVFLGHKFKKCDLKKTLVAGVQLFSILFGVVILALTKVVTVHELLGAALDNATINNTLTDRLMTIKDFPDTFSGFGKERSVVLASSGNGILSTDYVLWFENKAQDTLAPGSRVLVTGKIGEEQDNIRAALTVNVSELQRTSSKQSLPAFLRTVLRKHAEQVPGGQLVPGFAVGDTSLVSEKLDFYMKESSLTHLTAVSGSNSAMITALVIGLLGRFRVGKKTRIAAAGITLFGFVLVVGPDASVLRATIMATVMLISGFGGKKNVALASLGLAMIILLIADPWQAKHPGFTLSVAATAGILLLNKPLENGINYFVRLPPFFTLPLTVSLAAQIACAPLLLLLQPGIPAAGIPANILAAPAAPAGTLFGLLALLFLPVFRPLGSLMLFLATVFTRWVESTAEISAGLPFARWPWPGGPFGATMLFLIEMLIFLAVLNIRLAKKARPLWSRRAIISVKRKTVVSASVALAIGIFSGFVFVTPIATRLTVPRKWAIVACDVGQGDATLIRNPKVPKEIILVDTGDDIERLNSCLSLFGVKKLSTVVLTHDDRDHVGALAAVLSKSDNFIVAKPLDGEEHSERKVVQELQNSGKNITLGVTGLKRVTGSETEGMFYFEVLHPHEEIPYRDDNAGSMVLAGRADTMTFLMLADTGYDEHRELLKRLKDLRVDVVKVAHHGSKNFDPALLESMQAKYGIVSNGENNSYGHPSEELLDSLKKTQTVPLRTDTLGHTAIYVDGNELRFWSSKAR